MRRHAWHAAWFGERPHGAQGSPLQAIEDALSTACEMLDDALDDVRDGVDRAFPGDVAFDATRRTRARRSWRRREGGRRWEDWR